MTGAAKYFAKGFYDSSVDALFENTGGKLRIGIKCTSAPASYWTMFDTFRLYFFGGNSTTVGIKDITDAESRTDDSVYDILGRKISQSAELKNGLYIIGGKKVVIRK